MDAIFTSFGAFCAAAAQQPMLYGLFLAGVFGGATHCAIMCAPVLLAFGADRTSVRGIFALHSGRLVTYASLGAASAQFNGLIFADSAFAALSILLLSGAALILVLASIPTTRGMIAGALATLYRPFAPLIFRRIAALAPLPKAARLFATGALLGFMPCSMIVAALLAVSATGNPALAALGMALFVLGSAPSLMLTTGLAGQARKTFPEYTRWLEPVAMTVSAGVLMIHAQSLLS
jgi:uncharacterized protein